MRFAGIGLPQSAPLLLLLVAGESYAGHAAGGDILFASSFGEPLPLVIISADPSSVSVGQATTVSWFVSAADSCTASLGGATSWQSVSIPPNTGLFTTAPLETTTPFRLSCTNGFGTETATVSVAAVGSGLGFQGDGVFPEGCATSDENGTIWQHQPSMFGSEFGAWPGIVGAWQDISIETDHWVALWFATGPELTTGKMDTVGSVGPGGAEPKIYALSPCPGDFVSLEPACVISPAAQQSSLWWSTSGSTPNQVCNLEPNTDYYLNIIFAEAEDLDDTLCRFAGGEPRPLCTFQGIPRGPWK